MNWFNIALNILCISAYLIFGVFISVILHELGHLFFGRLSGYKFVSFRLMKWQWAKDLNGKIKLIKGTGLGGTLGQCLMEPCDDEKDFRFILYNSGGGIVNLITGLIFLALFIFSDNKFIQLSSYGICIAAITLGITNLMPYKKALIPNDGANLKEALKSDEAKHGLYLLLKSNADMSKGKLLSAYDENIFTVSENADISNFFVANNILLHSAQLEEQCAYEQSYNELLRLNPSKLPPYYRCALIMTLMFHELVYFSDIETARERIDKLAKDKLFHKLITMKHPSFLPFNAAKIGLIDNDPEKARELIAQARKLNPTLQNPGQEHSISLMLDKLESCIV
jgi:Peptidase family M50.